MHFAESMTDSLYYLLEVRNERPSCPATNTRIYLTTIHKKGPDGVWRERVFSGPTQVMWRWPQLMPLYLTVGPDEVATFGCLLSGDDTFGLQVYWCPHNLDRTISANDPTRLNFQAVSDTERSNILTIEVAWDGEWVEGSAEMAEHLVVKEITA